MVRDETILLIAGGGVAAFLIYRHVRQAVDAGEDPFVLTPFLTTPPPVIAPGATLPAATSPPSSTAPPPSSTAAVTPPAAAAAASNAAFDAQEAAARADQASYFDQAVADLKRRVASGEVTPGTPYYNSTLEYLSTLPGGVATKQATLAQLAAQGLAGATRRPRGDHLRLVPGS